MSSTSNNSEVPTSSELSRRFREESFEFRRNRAQLSAAHSAGASVGTGSIAPPACVPLRPEFVPNERGYHVRDFLRFHHGQFIEAGYRAILLRAPDSEGLRRAVEFLERGGSKIRFLGGLRYSDEGKTKRIRVTGLRWRYIAERAFRVPVLGYVLETAVAIARLPVAIRHHRALEFYTAGQAASIASLTQRLEFTNAYLKSEVGSLANRFGIAEANMDSLTRQIADVATVHAQSQAALGEQIRALKFNAVEQADSVATLTQQIADLATIQAQSQAALHDQIRTIVSTLNTDILRLTGEIEWIKGADARDGAKAREMDPFYIAFEDRFRGTRAEIRSRVEVYVPLVAGVKVISPDAPVLDLGCGRGEWLEVLRDQGLPCRGVDLNAISIADCRERGLQVDMLDALGSLKLLADESLGAITSMHLVEHLPFQVVLELLVECRRVLKSGGLLILETPNPENILVGSNHFYLDPTHRNPIPSALLNFAVESAGFGNVSIMNLHPSELQWPEVRSEMDRYMIQSFFGARDYAVVGYKP